MRQSWRCTTCEARHLEIGGETRTHPQNEVSERFSEFREFFDPKCRPEDVVVDDLLKFSHGGGIHVSQQLALMREILV